MGWKCGRRFGIASGWSCWPAALAVRRLSASVYAQVSCVKAIFPEGSRVVSLESLFQELESSEFLRASRSLVQQTILETQRADRDSWLK